MIREWDRLCYYNGGSEVHEVVKYGAQESTIRNKKTGQTFSCTNAKLHADVKLKIQGNRERKASADAIGRPKTKPGKR